MAKIVLFVDALEPREITGTRFGETQRGRVDSGAPKVTPKVTSEVYTGLSPSENGMGAQHSINGERTPRPRAPTIQEILDRAGHNVASFYMPYCHPLQIESQAFVSDTMQGPQPGQHPLAQMSVNPPVPGDLMDPDDDGEFAWNARTDEIYARSSNLQNAIRAGGFDVVFLGIRSPDQYTHFQWHEDYRRKLLEDIAYEIERWEVNHDVLWWSDHGSEEKQETFRVNKWLIEKGYLDLSIDLDFHERFTEEMSGRQPGQDDGPNVENQLSIQSPGVELGDGAEVVSMDPYDSSLDILDPDSIDVGDFISDLEGTGYYDRVARVEDEWGDGRFIEECPDIVALRADNVLVTGNVHPEPIGMGFHRSGVHSKYGAWGTTDADLARKGDVTPRTLHDVILEFVTGSSALEEEVQRRVSEMEAQFQQAIGDD